MFEVKVKPVGIAMVAGVASAVKLVEVLEVGVVGALPRQCWSVGVSPV